MSNTEFKRNSRWTIDITLSSKNNNDDFGLIASLLVENHCQARNSYYLYINLTSMTPTHAVSYPLIILKYVQTLYLLKTVNPSLH